MLDIKIFSYEEFLERHKKYPADKFKCFVYDCNKPAPYEGGDARFWCAMCEEHAGMKDTYRVVLNLDEQQIKARMLWDKDAYEEGMLLLDKIQEYRQKYLD